MLRGNVNTYDAVKLYFNMDDNSQRSILLQNLEDTVHTKDKFYFVESLKNSGEPLYIAKDEDILHLILIKIYSDSYSVKYSVKDKNDIMNIDQVFIDEPEDTAQFINKKIKEISKKIGQD
jgi:hypothetical protein